MIYEAAGDILAKILQHEGSLKNLIYENTCQSKKQLYALVCETLKARSLLDIVLCKSKLKKNFKDDCLWRILIYEHVFGKGLRGKWLCMFKKHKSTIEAEVARLKVKHKVATNADLLKAVCKSDNYTDPLPRYARVNTLKCTTADVIKELVYNGYQCIQNDTVSQESFLQLVKNLTPTQFTKDNLIPELLVFGANADLHESPPYNNGRLILQDKASCLPVYVLSQLGLSPGNHLLDCCAAPGNKTSYAAAVLQNQGSVFAYDKDKKRLTTMRKMLSVAGATCVQCQCQDFLQVDPTDTKFQRLEFAVVDPSCTGSGIVSRLNSFTNESDSETPERLAKLSAFQCSVLEHALSFRSVQTVVYSTCSIHAEENEEVVATIMKRVGDKFDVIRALPNYPSRGLSTYKYGEHCLRLGLSTDLTNGFFIAVFQRKTSSQTSVPDAFIPTETDAEKTQKPKHNKHTQLRKSTDASIKVKNKGKRPCTEISKSNSKRKRKRHKNKVKIPVTLK